MSSEAAHAELKAALEAFFADVARQKSVTPPPPLLPHFEIIDRWQAKNTAHTSPQLRHFLQNKSYQKALHHLEGKPVEGH
ncbi:hypothetical protein SAMN05444156_3047 [Verrucomicrobium sp. GAS474]|uniref:hypothetical protein n=1 Tax=Verrucomicrobium sp. GAS474 TaxID=1882831 RepID=UPI00087B4490|nr:hypothetical protein [Verrucomicrobium sp. GAS474]SDU28254.1 hypothetical protein SAMN05444156_3047 [Verrucomicrobium sp. GAS474]